MDGQKSIIRYQTAEYGCVRVKLAEVMEARGITRNRLRTLTGVKYDVIDRYYKGSNVALADLDFLAKVCYVLDCEISDLLEYQPPQAFS
jgi:putative transcriptional regulator